jgi:hypothetical protein
VTVNLNPEVQTKVWTYENMLKPEPALSLSKGPRRRSTWFRAPRTALRACLEKLSELLSEGQ